MMQTTKEPVFVILLVSAVTSGYWINDFDHPCVRDCDASHLPTICEYHWTIESYYSMSRACYQCPFEQFDCRRPDCVPMAGFARPIYSVNRRLPGPSIQVCENDMIIIHVHNRMQNEESESIHWHGFHMKDTQYMDGVTKITQCPLNTGHDVTYEFPAQAGTHWWHSHAGLHRADGIFGSLIVRQSSETDPHRALYDEDEPQHVLVVSEWAMDTSIAIATAGQHGATVTQNEGILINGRGTNKVFNSPAHPDATNVTVDHHIVYVQSGQRYRFRVIGAANDICPLTISIDNHKLKVIAMDGAPIIPVTVDKITAASGERYDFVLEADQEPNNYWIRVAGELACQAHQEVGILRYAGTEPGTLPSSDRNLRVDGITLNSVASTEDEQSIAIDTLRDLEENKEDIRHADVTHYLELDGTLRNGAKSLHHPVFYPYESAANDTFISTPLQVINNITMAFPPTPLLDNSAHVNEALWCNAESLRTSGKDCSREACECIHRIDIKYNDVVELVYINPIAFIPHPMHLHGYYLDIIAMETMWDGFRTDDFKRLDAQGKIHRNFNNPPRKDTFMVPSSGYLIARFKADNPGWWLMHCHFDTHLAIGMAMVFHVDGYIPKPSVPMPTC